MELIISARGHTSILLVLNMKRFVRADDRERFELARGTEDFGISLRRDWIQQSAQQNLFVPLQGYKRLLAHENPPAEDSMISEEIAFATGIFRMLVLERFVFPTYQLERAQLKFPPELESNFQFKKLFREALDRWTVCIHPSVSGFFILRLTQYYETSPRSFLSLARDILHLQESLDIPSAQRRLEYNRQKYKDDPAALEEKEQSIRAFLKWLGVGENEPSNLLYYPAQWKIAMEVVGRFVSLIGCNISLPNGEIHFEPPPPNPSVPLHDSYVIHHFDSVLAHPSLLAKKPKKELADTVQIPVSPQDIRQSPHLRRAFANIMEGTVLVAPPNEKSVKAGEPTAYFPYPRWSIADALMEDPAYNQASWNDELCLMSGRTTVIIPSAYSHEHELAVTTVPGASLKVKYAQYWSAIERMVELIFEIRVLAQLIESESYRFLGKFAATIEKSRLGLTEGDIVLDSGLRSQMVHAANLRRIVALVQSLSHPQFWSRTEYAIRKAEYLFAQLGVSQTLEHIEHNIASINTMLDQIDQLYLADLSEKGNAKSASLSMALAAASLTLTLLMLPSFWIDGIGIASQLLGSSFSLRAILPKEIGYLVLLTIIVGTVVGFCLIGLAVILINRWRRNGLIPETSIAREKTKK